MTTKIRDKSKPMIFDFPDGINNFLAANRIPETQLATASNVWYDSGAIRHRGAFKTGLSTFTLSIGAATPTVTSLGQSPKVINLTSNNYVFNIGTVAPSGGGSAQIPIYSSNPASSFSSISEYSTGTASTTISSATVTGSGTSWSTTVQAGDVFIINSSTQMATIQTVVSDTQLTLSTTYNTTNTGVAYTIYPNFNANFPMSFETIGGKVYMTNTGRAMGSWDGTTWGNPTSAPKAHFLKQYQNYLFAANTSANPARLFWSGLLAADTWPASNFLDVSPNDGQQITGLFYDGQSLLVIKQRSIYRVQGNVFDPSNPTYTVTQVYTPPECVFDSVNSWQIFKNNYILYGGSGLYQYNGSAVTRLDLSDNLIPTYTGTGWAPANFSSVEISEYGQQAVTFNGNYWISSYEAGGNGGEVLIDRNLKSWLFNYSTTQHVYGFFILPASGSTYNNLWAFGHDSGSGNFGTFLLDQSFSNESINASFTTKIYEWRNKQLFGFAYLHFKRQSSGTITFGYKIDNGSTTNVSVDMTTGTGNVTVSPPIIIGQIGNTIQFVVSHNSSSEDFEVYGIELETNDLRQ